MIGKWISSPLRILNAPARAAENIVGAKDDNDRILSQPLEELAKETERAVDGSQDDKHED